MNIISILFVSVGLAMDAFAVALASGTKVVGARRRHALLLGTSFGVAQTIMPLIGWVMGVQLKPFIESFDHWVAFGVLAFIGGKMLWESFADGGCEKDGKTLDGKRLFLLSLATSVDALAVGVTLAFLNYPVLVTSVIIGCVTFIIATVGGLIGCFCCCVWGRRAEMAGGMILILMGLKILAEHLKG